MDSQQFLFKHSVVGWRRFGKGPEAVLCFHGYGEKAETFEFLGRHAGERFSFYAIDLPHHGDTIWQDGDLSIEDLLEIIEKICPQPAYTLLGFSLGGRICLDLYENKPAFIKKMVLLAPDGLKENFWYWLATQTAVGRTLFRFTMKYPGWFFGLLRLLNVFRLVNASVFKFVKYYIGDREMRDHLYLRWISLRKIRPNIPEVKKQIREHKTSTVIIYGIHDRIIIPSVGNRFAKSIEEFCRIKMIPSGHQVLHEKHAGDIINALDS